MILNGIENLECGDYDHLSAFERATDVYQFCPNRVWTVAQSLPGGEQSLPILFPQEDEKVTQVFDLLNRNREYDPEYHGDCTYKRCEISQLNFTAIPQRHEYKSCKGFCTPTYMKFPRSRLDVAARQGLSTAWHLNGRAVISNHHKFMAVSHVWSDGTGTGDLGDNQVNSCLYGFLASIARQLG